MSHHHTHSISDNNPSPSLDASGSHNYPFESTFDDSKDDPFHGKFTYFDDAQLIGSSNQYVQYDSKQAQFESDLGPRENAENVTLMLPPRWDTKWKEDGLGGEEFNEGATVGIVDDDLGGCK